MIYLKCLKILQGLIPIDENTKLMLEGLRL